LKEAVGLQIPVGGRGWGSQPWKFLGGSGSHKETKMKKKRF